MNRCQPLVAAVTRMPERLTAGRVEHQHPSADASIGLGTFTQPLTRTRLPGGNYRTGGLVSTRYVGSRAVIGIGAGAASLAAGTTFGRTCIIRQCRPPWAPVASSHSDVALNFVGRQSLFAPLAGNPLALLEIAVREPVAARNTLFQLGPGPAGASAGSKLTA